VVEVSIDLYDRFVERDSKKVSETEREKARDAPAAVFLALARSRYWHDGVNEGGKGSMSPHKVREECSQQSQRDLVNSALLIPH
jgi:hypothetical protein